RPSAQPDARMHGFSHRGGYWQARARPDAGRAEENRGILSVTAAADLDFRPARCTIFSADPLAAAGRRDLHPGAGPRPCKKGPPPMASIFRPTYTDKATGRPRKLRRWYVKYRDADGIVRRVAGYADREATKQLAARLEREAARRQEGMIDPCAEHHRKPLAE